MISTLSDGSLEGRRSGPAGSVFLDHAGSSLPTTAVVRRQCLHLAREQEVGGYAAAAEVETEFDGIRADAGKLLGFSPTQIALGESSTVLWSRALSMAPLAERARIVVTEYEYGSNLLSLVRLAQERELTIDVVPTLPDGLIDVDSFAKVVTGSNQVAALVALCHAPSSAGVILDVQELARVASALGALVVVDACQSVGQIETINLGANADVVVCSRKYLRGPRGTAFVGVSDRFLESARPLDLDICGGRLDSKLRWRIASPIGLFERWERNVGGCLGLGVAVKEALSLNMRTVADRQGQLANSLRERLAYVAGVHVTDPASASGSAVTFVTDAVDASSLVALLRARGTQISESEVYTAPLYLPQRVGRDVNRASVGRTTEPSDISAFCEVLGAVLAEV